MSCWDTATCGIAFYLFKISMPAVAPVRSTVLPFRSKGLYNELGAQDMRLSKIAGRAVQMFGYCWYWPTSQNSNVVLCNVYSLVLVLLYFAAPANWCQNWARILSKHWTWTSSFFVGILKVCSSLLSPKKYLQGDKIGGNKKLLLFRIKLKSKQLQSHDTSSICCIFHPMISPHLHHLAGPRTRQEFSTLSSSMTCGCRIWWLEFCR